MSKQISSVELKKLELEIAKEVKKICDENNIDYFIIGGTLLGAVRHKGFIPWDDDMDIGMTWNNYQRFLKLAPEKMDDRFFIQTCQTDLNYHNIFAKVRLRNTHMIEKVTENIEICDGIFVDIFPYISIKESLLKSKCYMFRLRILGKMSLLKHNYDLNGITESSLSRFLNDIMKILPFSSKTVDKKLYSLLSQADQGKGEAYYIECDGMFSGDFAFLKTFFDNLIELPFEDTSFKAPFKYDDYLTKAYGNYMEYPPQKEREKGHSLSGVIIDNELQSYFKE